MTLSIPESLIEAYISELREQFVTGHAREHAYRPALKKLMNSFEDITAINDPKRSDNGNPDFIFLKTSNTSIILGYAEAKDITVDILKTAKTEQLRRYAGYEKLFLTNYLDFHFYRNGEVYQEISIGKIKDGEIHFDQSQYERLAHELKAFIELPPETIKSGKRLALIMGGKARRIRDNVALYLDNKENEQNHELEKIYVLMRELLVHDLSTAKFADMYAQTLVYGLFVARYNDKTPESFSRSEARDLVPTSNPFLREFFDHIVGPRFDKRLGYIVDELCEVFGVSDVKILVQKHLRLFEVENDKDPIIHFYEDFLKEYDPDERKKMGAYYTPVPVVKFIISSVDNILKEEFGLPNGLADSSREPYTVSTQGIKHKVDLHKVQVLDPAVGTATFLNETIKHVRATFEGQEGRWPAYAKQELLPRLHGFELMMAPYTIAHLKLGMTLSESGVDSLDQRLGVYLTNTLEEGIKRQLDLFTVGLAEVVTQESIKAAEIKHDRPIMVVMGNPPYSGESSNKTEFAKSLVNKYKVEPGGLTKLNERNPKWLNDDYVKFIAFAEEMINKNGTGVVAMITNHSYLDNPTFRGMRWHLTNSFDKIYILDLHGNYKKLEKSPDGSKDQNVFDIQQGVAIILGVKTSKRKSCEVFHADIYGTRDYKFTSLLGNDVEYKKLELDAKTYVFRPNNDEGKKDYEKGIGVDELFIKSSAGVVTGADKSLIALTAEELQRSIEETINGDSSSKVAERLRSKPPEYSNIARVDYRPFDTRYIYYERSVVERSRWEVAQHILAKPNVSLMVCRQQKTDGFYHALVHSHIAESSYVSNKTSEIGSSYPLYLFHEDGSRSYNFKPAIVKRLMSKLPNNTDLDQVFDYVYGVLYDPTYRLKYESFLKQGYPKIPIPTAEEFNKLSKLGTKLKELHLMKSVPAKSAVTYPESGTDTVEKLYHNEGKVWISESQYFGNISLAIWGYRIGSYLPAQKWLKDRIGRKLINDDIEHYEAIINAISETIDAVESLSK